MSSTLPPTDLNLADALKAYREQNFLTQEQLARRLRIPTRSLQNYEAGAMPHLKRRQRIVTFLARSVGGVA